MLLLCKCAKKPFNSRNLPIAKGTTGANCLTRHRDARSMLCDCPWKVRFKKQLNDSWILTQLAEEHRGHQLEGINPLAYFENRPMTAEAKQIMVDLVQNSSASLTSITSVLNVGEHCLVWPTTVSGRCQRTLWWYPCELISGRAKVTKCASTLEYAIQYLSLKELATEPAT
ncbi:hypothetical protein LIPSTDRAFT_71785 [Lipomyces starkeyi NRRL Y-11557]|uniref:Uncharacterized protein n=1 Tax=Lipomyces starkeyi NRRL Y-11557 TaxID=675824 RepID=A0A1E3Q6Q6_LIPST|nr:hypothetical protein LIPSTDRAFT_71785 [Lipomyces starkeyi NRRL Y-11557]